ncbi:RsmE family RNA methyltransferase [Kiritimatiellota bacterium B12222]|nr:RsmE family RNA methyltransferase [Kiritimatiellota bacterium B12222]
MTAPRCFSSEPELFPGLLELSKEEGRHLSRVRRISVAATVTVLNGRGTVAQGRVATIDRDRVSIELDQIHSIPPESPEITLVIGALKQSAWDEVLKHAVELGVNRIIRFQSQHAVSEIKAEKESKKNQRWQECMREACKQSGNPWVPELVLADQLETVRQHLPESAIELLAGLVGTPQSLAEVLPQRLPEKIVVWIGPEGDFSPAEQQAIQSGGAQVVTLGSRVLRAETAALALLAHLRLLGNEYNDRLT